MNKGSAGAFFIVFLAVVGGLAWYFYGQPDSDPYRDNLAKCLGNQAVLYTTVPCAECARQIKTYGQSVKFLRIVDCSVNPSMCAAYRFEIFPTWVFDNGERVSGETNTQELARVSGCTVIVQ